MNEHVDELLALYALGGLEADELKAVTDHLAVCAVCQAEAQRQTALVAALAASVPPRAPNPRLRAQVLAQISTAPAAPVTARPRPAPVRPPRQPWSLSRVLGGAFAVLAAVLIGWNVLLTNEVMALQHRVQYNQNALALIAGADTAHMPLLGQGAFATAGGNAYINQKTQDVVLVVDQLKPLTADQTYQAWIIGSQGPVSAGLFRVSDTGWGMTWLNTPYIQGGVIGVSLEPNGGSLKPTQVVLITAQ